MFCLHLQQSRRFRGDLKLVQCAGLSINYSVQIQERRAGKEPKVWTQHDAYRNFRGCSNVCVIKSSANARVYFTFCLCTQEMFVCFTAFPFKIRLFFPPPSWCFFFFFYWFSVFGFSSSMTCCICTKRTKHAYGTPFKSLYRTLLWEMPIQLLSD